MRIVEMQKKHYKGIIKIAHLLRCGGWFTKRAVTRLIPASMKTQVGFVAVEKKKIVGFIIYTSNENLGIICWLGVHPKIQKQGIGKKLVKKVEDEFKSAKIKMICVETVGWSEPIDREYMQTRKFYRTMGFKRVKKRGKVHKCGDSTYQMYTFSKRLRD